MVIDKTDSLGKIFNGDCYKSPTECSNIPGKYENGFFIINNPWNRNECFQLYMNVLKKKSMIIVCNIWMICLELNWFFYNRSKKFQLSELVWKLWSSVWVESFLIIFSLYRQQIEVGLVAITIKYFSTFFANTPF